MHILDNTGFTLDVELLKKDGIKITDIQNDLVSYPETFGNIQAEPVVSWAYNPYDKVNIIVPYFYFINKFPGQVKNILDQISLQKPRKFNRGLPVITLRPGVQEECFNSAIKSKLGGFINLSTGTGKTVLALKIFSVLKLKTLVIVNKNVLVSQWVSEIKKHFNNEVTVGLIQGKTIDIAHDICIGMLQSISMKDNIDHSILSEFDLVFIDEVHGTSSKVFSNVFLKFRPSLLFGLSATLDRRDKTDFVYRNFIGEVICSNTGVKKQKTEIIYSYYNTAEFKEFRIRGGELNLAKMLTSLSEDVYRNKLISELIKDQLKTPERNILVVSDRVKQLRDIHKLLPPGISGLFIGKMKPEELEDTKKQRVILATYALVNEGFNLPKLNTLIFATPRSSVTQVVGRIFRKQHTVTPVIVDIIDDHYIYKVQNRKRKVIYTEQIKM